MGSRRAVVFSLVAIVASLAGCEADSGSAAPCRVARGECRFGLLSATCGADAASPTFACDPATGRCAWFTSECLAEGFEPSPCPASGVCCVDGYPFDATWREPVVSDTLVHDFLWAWGTTPWDDAREAAVTVTIDPALAAAPLAMTCTGAVPEPAGPCGPTAPLRTFTAADVPFALAIGDAGPTFGGWNLWIESVGERARVCRAPFTDGVAFTCTGVPGPDCAVSGTLVLSRDASAGTDGAHGRLDVSLASGASLVATF